MNTITSYLPERIGLGVYIAGAVTGLTLWSLRKFIQGYWFDKSCTVVKDLKGYTSLVTGGNSGVGFETAVDLAARGSHVIIACRNEGRAKEAVQEIKRRTGSKSVEFMLLDMAKFESVTKFAQSYKQPLHIFVSNAGISTSDGVRTSDGHDPVWQCNYLAAFLLTELLLPVLQQSSLEHPARIVSVASGAHSRATIDWADPSGNPKTQYGQSKLAQIMHMKALQTELDEQKIDITAVSCTPGMASTSMTDQFISSSWKLKLLSFFLAPILWYFFRSSAGGAQCIIQCCVGDVEGGAYYSNTYKKPTIGANGISNDKEAINKLHALSKDSLKQWLPIK